MALVKIQGADVELCNSEGETPLMLAAATGNCVLCDVSFAGIVSTPFTYTKAVLCFLSILCHCVLVYCCLIVCLFCLKSVSV